MKLTPPQSKILEFLQRFQVDGQPMPSIQEITDHCHYASTRATRDHLDALERGGWISRTKGKARSLQVVDKTQNTRFPRIPILGSIPAGMTEEQSQSQGRWLDIAPSSLGLENTTSLFAVDVRGDSMIERGIFDGDLAIIDSKSTPANGDAVAALVDEEVTLKTLIQKGNHAYLKAENPSYHNIFPLHSLQIQGVVRTIIRTL